MIFLTFNTSFSQIQIQHRTPVLFILSLLSKVSRPVSRSTDRIWRKGQMVSEVQELMWTKWHTKDMWNDKQSWKIRETNSQTVSQNWSECFRILIPLLKIFNIIIICNYLYMISVFVQGELNSCSVREAAFS